MRSSRRAPSRSESRYPGAAAQVPEMNHLPELCRRIALRGNVPRGRCNRLDEMSRDLAPRALGAAAQVPEMNHLRELCRSRALRADSPRGGCAHHVEERRARGRAQSTIWFLISYTTRRGSPSWRYVSTNRSSVSSMDDPSSCGSASARSTTYVPGFSSSIAVPSGQLPGRRPRCDRREPHAPADRSRRPLSSPRLRSGHAA